MGMGAMTATSAVLSMVVTLPLTSSKETVIVIGPAASSAALTVMSTAPEAPGSMVPTKTSGDVIAWPSLMVALAL